MKIGINGSFLRKPGTGIGQVTVHFLRTLTNLIRSDKRLAGNRYVLYCEEKPALDFTLSANIEIRNFLPRWWKRDDVPRKWLWERELVKRAAEDNCDVFISLYQSATDFHISSLTPHASTVRHVMVVHDIIPKLFPEYLGKISQRLHWDAVEKGIRHADHIIAISETTKNDLGKYLRVSEEKISVAYPDASPRFHEKISTEIVDAVLKKYNLKRGYIYHGGGLEVRKNTKRLLEAYAQFLQKEREVSDLPRLVLSGKIFPKSNTLATDVKDLVKTLHLEEEVALLDFVPEEDLPALYRGALFFVYPSLYEGFGLPVLEALRMGTPVLSSNTASLPEVGGDAVLYCDPNRVDSIVSGIQRLFHEKSTRENLLSKSHSQVLRFDWRRFVQTIVNA
ncbi:MAG: glycosyltransferase family 4 protein [Candidatus Moranbacteria bacterium]|nr:glycosyltransferase family 4 protein [Candidatus Moranbacteria bacterium]